MTNEEGEAVDKLIEREGAQEKAVSLARTEPGEKGPIRVEIDGQAWHVDGSSVRKQKVS